MISTETIQIRSINAPKDHQRAISKINTGLANLYYSEKKSIWSHCRKP